ncbi:TPA: serine/threonine protein kinase, partial [Streptococcus pyogenes]|nr:serine/threonine protein kinase [Streptococcus pyogenes]HEP4760322.1 serine/threonine protein kinase [Streptococcus pyogenes]
TVLYFGLVEISFDVPDFIFQKIKEQNNKIRYYSKSINILGSVKFINSNQQLIEYDGNGNILVYGRLKYFKEGISLYYIGEYLAECLLIEHSDTLLIHAAAVYNPLSGHSILLLGDKGAGKTTVAIRLCIEHGYHLIGNDQVIFGSNSGILLTYAGTSFFKIRRTAVLSDNLLFKLFSKFFNRSLQFNKASWDDKISIFPKELGIRTCNFSTEISKIYYIKTDKKEKQIYHSIWSDSLASLYLNELLGRHISGQVACFQSDNGKYFSTMPLINYEKNNRVREQIVKGIFAKQKLFKITAATPAKIAEAIIENVKKNS